MKLEAGRVRSSRGGCEAPRSIDERQRRWFLKSVGREGIWDGDIMNASAHTSTRTGATGVLLSDSGHLGTILTITIFNGTFVAWMHDEHCVLCACGRLFPS